MEYKRPEISDAETEKILKAGRKMALIPDQLMRGRRMGLIMYENARLLAEVNEHRIARGFDPLPVYDPLTGKNE